MPAPTLTELQQDRDYKARAAKEITDLADTQGRTLTQDEATAFDRLVNEIETPETGLDARITKLQADLDRKTRLNAIQDRNNASAGRIAPRDPPGTPTPTRDSVPATYRRCGALKAFKGPGAEERAYRAGMWAKAAIFNSEPAKEWCYRNGVNIKNTLAESSNTLGGALVPEEMSQAIIDLREQYGVFRQNCEVVPMGSDTMLIPRRLAGMTVYFVGENAEITASDPSWDSVRLTVKDLAGLCKLSAQLDMDAIINLADYIARELAYAFALKEDQCGFNGDGTSTYGGMRGICDKLVAGTLIGAVDATSGHDTFGEIDSVDLGKVMGALPAYARMNAKWYCSSVCMDAVFGRLMAAAGGNTIRDIQAGYQPQYLGYPIVISQVLQTTTSTINDVAMLLFGDLRLSSTLGDRRGISIFPSEHRYMEFNQIAIRGVERFDIVNHDLGDTTVAGPLVALIGNT